MRCDLRAWLCCGRGEQRAQRAYLLTAGGSGREFQGWGSHWLSLPGSPARFFSAPPPTLQLKSERELDKVKGLKLEELWLDGNPLCDTFRDQSTYIRSVVASVSPPGDLHPPGG